MVAVLLRQLISILAIIVMKEKTQNDFKYIGALQ